MSDKRANPRGAAWRQQAQLSMRRLPAPWSVEEIPGGFKVIDANGQFLAYVYGHAEKRNAQIAKALTRDEARRIASNIAKLPALLGHACQEWGVATGLPKCLSRRIQCISILIELLPRGGASLTRGGASLTRGGASLTRGGASLTRAGASLTWGGAEVRALNSTLSRHCSGGEGHSAQRNCHNQSLSDCIHSSLRFLLRNPALTWWSQLGEVATKLPKPGPNKGHGGGRGNLPWPQLSMPHRVPRGRELRPRPGAHVKV
jgi:hypothetical protein